MNSPAITTFSNDAADPPVHGLLHTPATPNGSALVLTHGAGANCQSKLLTAMADAFAATGLVVLRFDLPFRIDRRFGPPRGNAERDRAGVRRAATLMKENVSGEVFVGGHSYGGRQASMLLAEESQLAAGLLLLSYPLHPPNKPAQLRTAHFAQLLTPSFFVHGANDPFGTLEEMQSALELIPAPHALSEVPGAAHDLLLKKTPGDLPVRVAKEFQAFIASASR
jgi:uncharacterized protein